MTNLVFSVEKITMNQTDKELFIKVIKDINTHGWKRSKASESEKHWTLGQIMRYLPKFWVQSLFGAAKEGIETSSDMVKFVMQEIDEYEMKMANEWIFGRRGVYHPK